MPYWGHCSCGGLVIKDWAVDCPSTWAVTSNFTPSRVKNDDNINLENDITKLLEDKYPTKVFTVLVEDR